MGKIQRVIAAVIQRNDQYLLCQRPIHKRHGALWEFPGGKVHDGETDFGAISRELAEELAVRVTHVGETRFSDRDPGSDFVIEFLDVEIEEEPVCHEHDALQWISLGDALELPLAPSDRAFVDSLVNTEWQQKLDK